MSGKIIGVMMAALVVIAAVVLNVKEPPKDKLHLYTWSDYFDPELLEQFENENDCKVVIDTFDSNESAFAKLTAGASGYDLITPTSYFIPTMAKNGIIAKFDISQASNVVANFDGRFSRFLLSTNFEYSVPYALSMTGVMYRKDVLPDGFDVAAFDWSVITNRAFRGRASLFNDPREVIGCAMRTLGYGVNSTNKDEIAEALALAKTWKRGILKMDNEIYKTAIAASELLVAMAYNSDAMQIMQDDDGVGFAVPKCGTTCCFDEFCISATAKHPELAYKFVDFMYNPTNAAKNVEYIFSVMPVGGTEELVDSELKNRKLVFPTDEILSRCELISVVPSETMAEYVKFWDELKAAK